MGFMKLKIIFDHVLTLDFSSLTCIKRRDIKFTLTPL